VPLYSGARGAGMPEPIRRALRRAHSVARWRAVIGIRLKWSGRQIQQRVPASPAEMFWADIPSTVSHLEFADSPLEGKGFEPSVPLW